MKTIGILGAGQLGRMFALSGFPFEMKFQFFDTSGSPSVGLEPTYIEPIEPLKSEGLKNFLNECDVVTYEFEHLPLDLVEHLG